MQKIRKTNELILRKTANRQTGTSKKTIRYNFITPSSASQTSSKTFKFYKYKHNFKKQKRYIEATIRFAKL